MKETVPKLTKGNCFVFSVLFYMNNPDSNILVSWNKKRNIPSFSCIKNGKRYFYKPIDQNNKRTLLFFYGQIIIVDQNRFK